MAGNMHMPTSAPACRLDPRQHNPRTLPIRQDWAFDGAASCGGATTAADRHRLVIHDPACLGCARYLRAVRVEDGRIIPHPRREGRAQPKPGERRAEGEVA